MHGLLVTAIAALVQLIAAFLALRLIRITGRRTAWVLIAGALCPVALLLGVKLWWLASGDLSAPPDSFDDSAVLAISLCMLAAVLGIPSPFLSIQRAAETLKQSKEKLEIMVTELTAALSDANIYPHLMREDQCGGGKAGNISILPG